MRHGNKLKHLGREASHRKAMLNNLATSILLKGLSDEQMNRQVRTTVQKAKAVRSLLERLITYAKKGDLTAKRNAAKFVKDKEVFKGLFNVLGERYKDRAGGYSRILKLSTTRHGDNAEMAIITLVEDELVKKKKKKPAKKKAANAGNVKDSKKADKPEADEAVAETNADATVASEPVAGAEESSNKGEDKKPVAKKDAPAEKAEKKKAPKSEKKDPPAE